ncbi:NUDIX domain-containing protein [Halobacteria archaeon AArc-m2/3/4]|uniref:NUDIX domain-containing protein n=1 Tax=Natronoglomus mannanivorans TaxID=2979990 RepID=A0ABT2Q8G1_9EURY|nr:NUDIX domain-containing protein [Halobacteria archaeon AArc-m2/3/4]
MGTDPYEYCPYCGSVVRSMDLPTAYYCGSCEEYVFDNPAANARVAVVDGDRILLVEIDDEFRIDDPPYDHDSEWMLPGGHVEVPEQPREAAARELEEETGLVADSEDLELFETVYRQVVEGAHAVLSLYAIEKEATTGTLNAGSDAADVRFWTPAELGAADASFRELHVEPRECNVPEWWVRRALEATTGRVS